MREQRRRGGLGLERAGACQKRQTRAANAELGQRQDRRLRGQKLARRERGQHRGEAPRRHRARRLRKRLARERRRQRPAHEADQRFERLAIGRDVDEGHAGEDVFEIRLRSGERAGNEERERDRAARRRDEAAGPRQRPRAEQTQLRPAVGELVEHLGAGEERDPGGRIGTERSERRHDQPTQHAVTRGEPQRRLRAGRRAHGAQPEREIADQRTQPLARVGGHDAATRPTQHGDTQRALDLADLSAQLALPRRIARRRLGETTRVDGLDEGPQTVEREPSEGCIET